MNLIGYWFRDLSDCDFMAPQELSAIEDESIRNRLAAYLEGGRPLRSYRGGAWCRFRCGIESIGGSELTDGRWVWPEGLAHYVRVHRTELPAEFIDHALANRPVIETRFDESEISLDYWLDWCSVKRDPEFVEELERARNEAEARFEKEKCAVTSRERDTEDWATWFRCFRPGPFIDGWNARKRSAASKS